MHEWFYLRLDNDKPPPQCWINFLNSIDLQDCGDWTAAVRITEIARELVDYNAIIRKKSKSRKFFIRFNSEADAVAFIPN